MTPDDIGAAVQAGSLTHQQGIAVYSTLYGQQANAPALTLPCEECGRLTQLAVMVSYKLWVAMPGHPAVAGYDEHDQHFCCSHDCARAQLITCFDAHLRPEAERRCLTAAQAQAQRQAPAIVATIGQPSAPAQDPSEETPA